MAAVRDGSTVFVPKNWEKTYFEWMENIQPWCISRQLWWGHRIPAWYGPDGKVFVAETEEEAVSRALAYYAETEAITPMQAHDMALDPESRAPFLIRDEDVLDTWFSSALWAFSTLGWPDRTPELARYYPTDTLVTGFDIIFFWVARMMMMGLHFMKEVPFRTVYIHALVRDEKGAKMSKSKGNVIDPLALIDEYGADALRFTLAAMAAQGRDIKLAKSRVEGYRNFATKLWNACRFAEMNGCATLPGFEPDDAEEVLNRWIAHETARTVDEVTAALEAYKFNEAASAVYQFVWNVYCDWYIELAKPVLLGPESPAKTETCAMVAWARDQILALLHPFMPFITEELWAVTAEGGVARDGLLALSPMAAPHRAPRRGGGSRDRLGDRPRQRDPLGARGDEHSAGLADSAAARGGVGEDPREGGPLGRHDQAPGADRRHFLCRCAAPGRRAAPGARRHRGAAAQGRHRPRRREDPARKGTGEGRLRPRARGRQARQCRFRRPRGGRGGRGRARKARGGAGAPRQDSRSAGAAEIGHVIFAFSPSACNASTAHAIAVSCPA